MTSAVVALAVLALVSAAISAYLTLRQRRLLREAADRDAERDRLADQLITAEQDERRRLALFLHDGPVQSLAGIALLLDGVDHAITTGQNDQARRFVLGGGSIGRRGGGVGGRPRLDRARRFRKSLAVRQREPANLVGPVT